MVKAKLSREAIGYSLNIIDMGKIVIHVECASTEELKRTYKRYAKCLAFDKVIGLNLIEPASVEQAKLDMRNALETIYKSCRTLTDYNSCNPSCPFYKGCTALMNDDLLVDEDTESFVDIYKKLKE